MNTATHDYRTIDVPVPGGLLRVGVWDPREPDSAAPDVLLVHGVTSSHLAWPFLVGELAGARLIAPDLRGRGRSNEVDGPAGMAVHADDLVAVLDALEVPAAVVVGHSMGGFVAVTLVHRHPQRVLRTVLVDGGLPLAVPADLDPETLVQSLLGPTAARLSERFDDVPAYLGFWRQHPAFHADWTRELEEYLAYDLVPEGDRLRPATSYRTTVDDTIDMTTGSALREATAALSDPVLFITVPRGLQDEIPGLYPPAARDAILAAHPYLRHRHLDDLNHYTVVMSARGAAALGAVLREELAQLRATAS